VIFMTEIAMDTAVAEIITNGVATEIMVGVFISIISATVITGLTFYIVKVRGAVTAQEIKQEAIHEGVKALLYDRIVQLYNHYNGKKHIPIYARQNASNLHKEYKALGGNGVVDGLMKHLMNLPTEDETKYK